MTYSEIDKIIESDPYYKQRAKPTEAEIRLFLAEVDYHCPICATVLQTRHQKKPNQKMFQIAHIYPNRPTIEQYSVLHGLERLGDNSESFENKIALCPSCHLTQDFHTTQEDYLHLLEIKKRLLSQTALQDTTITLGLETEIDTIVRKISTTVEDLAELNYEPVPVRNKFSKEEHLLKAKIQAYVSTYYPFIRESFREIDGKNGFQFQVLSGQIKACYLKMSAITNEKSQVFSQMVQWIQRKTHGQSTEACEAVVSFFVQNCEVFNEIT